MLTKEDIEQLRGVILDQNGLLTDAALEELSKRHKIRQSLNMATEAQHMMNEDNMKIRQSMANAAQGITDSLGGLQGSPELPEIPRMLNMLKEQLQRTQKDLQTLAERLNPIMLPPTPQQAENMKMPVASVTQAGIEIESLIMMTDSIQNTIRHLQHSIQI